MSLYLWIMVVLKISLAVFFLRILTVQWHRNVVYVATASYAIFGVVFAFVALFQCGSPKDFLAHEVAQTCLSDDILQPLNYIAAIMNALTDWIVSGICFKAVAKLTYHCSLSSSLFWLYIKPQCIKLRKCQPVCCWPWGP